MKKNHSLLQYLLEARPDAAERWPDLVKRLKSEDVEIPDIFQHAIEAARFGDEEEKHRVNDPEGFNAWRQGEYAKRFPGLTSDEIYLARDRSVFAGSAAEVANARHHPKLMAVYDEICDELNLKKYGPNGNEPPRLILISSDAVYADIAWDKQPPTIHMSTAYFELGSSRMALSVLIHELAHLARNETGGIKGAARRAMKYVAPKTFSRREERFCDALPKKFGISGEELADLNLQTIQVEMQQTAFARTLRPLMEACHNEKHQDFPYLFSYLRYLENRVSLFLNKKNRSDTHPSTQERVVDALKDEPMQQQPDYWMPNYWRERLSGEFNKGELIPYKPPGVSR